MTLPNKKFLNHIAKKGYFDSHRKVLIALSGGLDSMTLFNWLYDLRDKLNIEIGFAHVNHGLREVSDDEEKNLIKFAKSREIPIYIDRFTGKFTEEAARSFRYQFFEKIMREHHYTALVTGHHKNDEVETILMREISGRPLKSLRGISERQSFANGELIRPLLIFEKSELDATYFFEDETNHGVDYFRNKVRNKWIPEFTKENPKFTQAISSLSNEINLAMSIINEKIAELEILDEKINLAQFCQQSKALQHFILQAYFEQFPEIQINKAKFQELLHILNRTQQYRGEIMKNVLFIKDDKVFYLSKKDEEEKTIILTEDPYDENFMQVNLPQNGEITVRKRQPQDEILINGHHKSLRKFFIENHIPLKKRENDIIFVDEKLYAIVGVGCSDLSKNLKNDKIKRTLWVKSSIREEHL